MTESYAMTKLKVGDRVKWIGGGPETLGTVVEIRLPEYGVGSVRFTWEDGQDGWIAMPDLANVVAI